MNGVRRRAHGAAAVGGFPAAAALSCTAARTSCPPAAAASAPRRPCAPRVGSHRRDAALGRSPGRPSSSLARRPSIEAGYGPVLRLLPAVAAALKATQCTDDDGECAAPIRCRAKLLRQQVRPPCRLLWRQQRRRFLLLGSARQAAAMLAAAGAGHWRRCCGCCCEHRRRHACMPQQAATCTATRARWLLSSGTCTATLARAQTAGDRDGEACFVHLLPFVACSTPPAAAAADHQPLLCERCCRGHCCAWPVLRATAPTNQPPPVSRQHARSVLEMQLLRVAPRSAGPRAILCRQQTVQALQAPLPVAPAAPPAGWSKGSSAVQEPACNTSPARFAHREVCCSLPASRHSKQQ